MEKQMDLNKESFIPVHTNIENVELDGEKVLRVVLHKYFHQIP